MARMLPQWVQAAASGPGVAPLVLEGGLDLTRGQQVQLPALASRGPRGRPGPRQRKEPQAEQRCSRWEGAAAPSPRGPNACAVAVETRFHGLAFSDAGPSGGGHEGSLLMAGTRRFLGGNVPAAASPAPTRSRSDGPFPRPAAPR